MRSLTGTIDDGTVEAQPLLLSMSTLEEKLLFFEDLSPEDQEAVRAALDDDPALADTLAHWQAVRAGVRRQLDDAVPDRSLLVLYALDASGHGEALTESEREALDAGRSTLQAALERHPGLQDVLRDVERAAVDFEEAWNTVPVREPRPVARRHADRAARPAARRRRGLRLGWRATAGVAFVLFVTILVSVLRRDAGWQTVTVADGSTRVVELADGSFVRLLGGSSLTFTETGRPFNRRVRLTGRAFFDVAPGQQGFSVETPTAVTTVLGTSFGIQADASAMEVVLASGRISVASKVAQDRIVVLDPGQRTRVARNDLPTTPTEVDLPEALSWTGLFIFRGTSLEDVTTRLEAHYGVSIQVPGALEEEGITGTFAPEQPVGDILRVLATTLGATVEQPSADTYRIVGGS